MVVFTTLFTYLGDVLGVLFHGDLLHSALKPKEGLDIKACCLFKASPVAVFWMDLLVEGKVEVMVADTARQVCNLIYILIIYLYIRSYIKWFSFSIL